MISNLTKMDQPILSKPVGSDQIQEYLDDLKKTRLVMYNMNRSHDSISTNRSDPNQQSNTRSNKYKHIRSSFHLNSSNTSTFATWRRR